MRYSIGNNARTGGHEAGRGGRWGKASEAGRRGSDGWQWVGRIAGVVMHSDVLLALLAELAAGTLLLLGEAELRVETKVRFSRSPVQPGAVRRRLESYSP